MGSEHLDTGGIRAIYRHESYYPTVRDRQAVSLHVLDTVAALCDALDDARDAIVTRDELIRVMAPALEDAELLEREFYTVVTLSLGLAHDDPCVDVLRSILTERGEP